MTDVSDRGDAGDAAPAAEALLNWYDRHARALPWRVSPADRLAGVQPDPYRIWLSEVMLQQTTVATAIPYFEKFTARWPNVEALAASPREELLAAWAGLGYYARARNLHKCAQIVATAHAGRFPESEENLLKLPGIGAYTAAAIAAIAYDSPSVVVDGNVERVMARVAAVAAPLPGSKAALKAEAARRTPAVRAGDYAQAVMDLGATICTPRSPACGLCPWRDGCAGRRAGIHETLPRKAPKAVKPIRLGVAYVACDADGRMLLERRPDAGLLGGMLGAPGTDWTEAGPSSAAAAAAEPCSAPWEDLGVEARHTFTHFHLRLALRGARLAGRPRAPAGMLWLGPDEIADAAVPTLTRKVAVLGLGALGLGAPDLGIVGRSAAGGSAPRG